MSSSLIDVLIGGLTGQMLQMSLTMIPVPQLNRYYCRVLGWWYSGFFFFAKNRIRENSLKFSTNVGSKVGFFGSGLTSAL